MSDVVSFEDALATVDATLAGKEVGIERVSVRHARGRALAHDALSRVDLPPFDKSAMDGYAVMADDTRDEYRVLEHVSAGTAPTRPLEPGAASKVMTGAPVPEGTGRVIVVENTDGGAETVRVFSHKGKPNLCMKGEDIRCGHTVLPAGARLVA